VNQSGNPDIVGGPAYQARKFARDFCPRAAVITEITAQNDAVQNGQAKEQHSTGPRRHADPPALPKIQEARALATVSPCHRLIDASLTIHVTNSS
jgi:hypothetical protein